MVVLAASVLAKSGKALVSRQYMEMSRVRIEGLLAAFPKLMGGNRQHTYVETEAVRYLYQPMEVRTAGEPRDLAASSRLSPCQRPRGRARRPLLRVLLHRFWLAVPQGLYLVLVTNKQSNILEDLETLRLLSKLVPEFSGSLEEEAICAHAFDLIFAFDEVISLGHKETITILQVKQNCEMESHEEKLHKMIIQVRGCCRPTLGRRGARAAEQQAGGRGQQVAHHDDLQRPHGVGGQQAEGCTLQLFWRRWQHDQCMDRRGGRVAAAARASAAARWLSRMSLPGSRSSLPAGGGLGSACRGLPDGNDAGAHVWPECLPRLGTLPSLPRRPRSTTPRT